MFFSHRRVKQTGGKFQTDVLRRCFRCVPRQDHGKLLAAVSGADGIRRTILFKYRADTFDHLVAEGVPEGVVYGLEIVDVRHDDREGKHLFFISLLKGFQLLVKYSWL